MFFFFFVFFLTFFLASDLANDAAIKRIEPNEIELGDRLAYGASGEVMKGIWKGREVAVKRMAFGQSQLTEKFMNDFLYEIKIMRYVPTCYD